jgi:hypothetical protein
MAASSGARLMLIARNQQALQALAQELSGKGADIDFAVADVSDSGQLQMAATGPLPVSAASTPGSTTRDFRSMADVLMCPSASRGSCPAARETAERERVNAPAAPAGSRA